MTRINTNVSSLVARTRLERSNADLNQALTRLSTGLRINDGRDDPAGLIASESLRSDIVSTQRAITNSERANQLIATADSGLGQVSALLNDIRGLVSEAANTGALSDEQIEANQLQVDSSLEAIDRIAQITTFQGRRLLDGSLGFITTGVDSTKIQGLQIDQANFGTLSEIGVSVEVVEQATRGSLNFSQGAVAEDVNLQVAGRLGTEAISIAGGSDIASIAKSVNQVSDATGVSAILESGATKGEISVTSLGLDNDIVLTAEEAGFDPGNVNVRYSLGTSDATTVNFTQGTGSASDTLDIQLRSQDYVAATASVDDGGAALGDTAKYHIDSEGANNDLFLTANNAGSDAARFTITTVDSAAGGLAFAFDKNARTLQIDLGGDTKTAIQVRDAINGLTGANQVGETFTASIATVDGDSGTNLGTGNFAVDAKNKIYEIANGTGADENALEFTAKVKGAEFNDVAVHFVDGKAFDGATGAITAGSEKAFYFHDARKAQAYVDLYNEVGTDDDVDFVIQAVQGGSAFNNVDIVFSTANIATGDTSNATYDADAKTLTIDIAADGSTTAATIKTAVENTGTFTLSYVGATADGTTYEGVNARQAQGVRGNTGFSGGDAGTLFIHIDNNVSTAAQVVTAISNTALDNDRVNELFEVINRPDQSGTGRVSAGAYSNAFTGGIDGGTSLATAAEVVEAINNSTDLAGILSAQVEEGSQGQGVVGQFEEFAYTGVAEANNRLQFLGGGNSRDIRFVADGTNTSLGIDLSTAPRVEAGASAIFEAKNANASLQFEALKKGPDFDNISILFEDTGGAPNQNTVVFNPEATKSFAVLDFTGANNEIKITANEGGTLDFNNVTINVTKVAGLGNAAEVEYVVTPKTSTTQEKRELNINVDNAGATKLSAVLAAINNEGTFSAALDTSVDPANDGSGTVNETTAALANTANSGTINGSLIFRVEDGVSTANDVINLLAGDDLANKFFRATNFGNSDGSGLISVADDTGSTLKTTLTSGGLEDEGTLIVNLATDEDGLVTTTANDLVEFFNADENASVLANLGISVSNAEGSEGTGLLQATEEGEDVEFATNGLELQDAFASGTVAATNGVNARFSVTALQAGSDFDGVTVEFEENPALTGGGDETATYDAGSKTLRINVKLGVSTAADVIAAINDTGGTTSDLFEAELVFGGDGTGTIALQDTGTLSGGVVESGNADGVSLLGNSDSSDSGLTFVSTDFGSNAFVQITSTNPSAFTLRNDDGDVADRSAGTDADARINGVQAVSNGLQATINTASLDLSFTLSEGINDGETFSLQIVGGGARFQLGPEVVSNQQARLGIQSLSTATLGGTSGKLFELRSGGAKNLNADPTGAAAIVDEVITRVTQLRGRLGAFQRTTLETQIFALNDTLAALTDAESSIRDADFAEETASLTRAQILVQSGTTVLGIANQNPQNVLALLR